MVTKGLLRSRQILLSFTKNKTLYKTTENPQILEWILTRKTLKKQEKTLSNTFLQFSQKTKNTLEKKKFEKNNTTICYKKHLLLPHPTYPRIIIEIQAKPNWDWWGRERSKWVFGEGENASPREEEDNKNVVLWRREEKRRDLFNKTKKNKKNKSGLVFLLFSSRKWRAKDTQSQPNTHHHSNLLSPTNNNLDLSTTILEPLLHKKEGRFFISFLFSSQILSSFLFPKTTSKLSFLHKRKNSNFSSLSKKKKQISHTLPNSCAFFSAIKWVYVWSAFLWLICVPSKQGIFCQNIIMQ